MPYSGASAKLDLANLEPAMTTVNIFEAKTQLSKLIELAEKGEEVVIARAGKPVVRLTKLELGKQRIRYGLLKGKLQVADDFDAPLPEDLLAEFENGPLWPTES